MIFKTLAASITAVAGLLIAVSNAAACNGHIELCDRKYSNVTFLGAHDSPFVGDDVSDNQNLPLAEQLAMGVRFLQAQTHEDEGTIKLCHSECFLRDAGPLEELLEPVKTFLDANPTEIITLLITNQDGLEASAYDAAFKRVGLDHYGFAPGGKLRADQWPTLGALISTGKRLVVFMDYPAHNSVPYIIAQFDKNIIETPFELTNLTNLAHCPVDRPAGAGHEDGMLLVNHWLQSNDSGILEPDKCMAIVTNSDEYIRRHIQSCQGTLGKTPTFILLDWVDIGDAILVQDVVNGLSPRTTRQNVTASLQLAKCGKLPDEPTDLTATSKTS